MIDITKIYESMSLQNVIMNNCDDAVTVKDLNLKYITCNKAFLQLLGIENEEKIHNKRIDEILSAKNCNIIKKSFKIISKTLQSNSCIITLDKDFSSKIYKVMSFPIIQKEQFLGILSITRDVTDEELLKLKLIEKIGMINSLLENIPMIAFLKDKNNNYITGSKYSKSFFLDGVDKYSDNIKLNLKDASEIIELEDNNIIKQQKKLIKEKIIQATNGQDHWYKIYKTPILDVNNEVNGIVSLAQNIDAEKQLELQKELFIATLTHDLKNPLQAQISSLELLSKGTFGQITDSQKDIVNMILESAGFMHEMLYSILATYKYDNGMVKLHKEIFNIEQLLKICIKEAFYLAKEKNIEIEYISLINNPNLFADESQIRRVIANLLNNAINYAYRNTKILATILEDDNFSMLKIRNISKPIPANMKDHIFDKYVSGSEMNKQRGIGLGLYFCKKVMEAHNGNISLTSFDKYNEFLICIPKEKIITKTNTLTFV